MPQKKKIPAETPELLTTVPTQENSQSPSGDAVDLVMDSAAASAASPSKPSKARTRGQAATPAELVRGLTQLLNFSSMLLALWLEEPAAIMAPQEARDIAEPAARLLAKTKWAKLAAKRLESSSDALALAFAVIAYGARVAPAVAGKVATRGTAKPISHPATMAGGGQPANGNPGSAGADFSYTGYGYEPPEAGADLNYSGGLQPPAA